jgi:hypothetical protein
MEPVIDDECLPAHQIRIQWGLPPVGCHPRLIGDMYRWESRPRFRLHGVFEMDHAVIQPVFCEVLICQSSVSPTAADLAKFIF